MRGSVEDTLLRTLAELMKDGERAHNSRPIIQITFINSPITVFSSPREKSGLDHFLHAFETKSIRLAIFVISMAALGGIVAYKLGYHVAPTHAPTVESQHPIRLHAVRSTLNAPF